MSFDISDILRDWPYEPGRLAARKIRGQDGTEKIQLRLDLGLLQMEVSGRPDGAHPNGCDSLLDYHEKQLELYHQKHGTTEGYTLDGEACDLLRAEALLYYHRYVAEFVLEDFQAVERDTARNLRLMDFCTAYASQPSDRAALEQHRPYVMMMQTRARCQAHLAADRPEAAWIAVQQGIEEIQDVYTRTSQENAAEDSAELAVLKALAEDLRARVPVDPLAQLKKALAKAVAEERYEEAAAIRDRIRRVSVHKAPPEGTGQA